MKNRDDLDSFLAITQCIKRYSAQITSDAQSFISDAQAEILAELYDNNSFARKRKQKEKCNLEKAHYEKLDLEIRKAIDHHLALQHEEKLRLFKEEQEFHEKKREEFNHAISANIEAAHLLEQHQFESQIQHLKTELENCIAKIQHHIEELTLFITELKNNIEDQRNISSNQFIESTKKWLFENYKIQNNLLVIPTESTPIYIEYEKLLDQFRSAYYNHFDKENSLELNSLQHDFQSAIKNIICDKYRDLSEHEVTRISSEMSDKIVNNKRDKIQSDLQCNSIQKKDVAASENKIRILVNDLNELELRAKKIENPSNYREKLRNNLLSHTKTFINGTNEILKTSQETLNQSKRNMTAISSAFNRVTKFLTNSNKKRIEKNLTPIRNGRGINP
jgi:hypothetical protein